MLMICVLNPKGPKALKKSPGLPGRNLEPSMDASGSIGALKPEGVGFCSGLRSLWGGACGV